VSLHGGSDISGTLLKLHRRIEKSFFLLFISCSTVSALCRSGNKNKQKLSAKKMNEQESTKAVIVSWHCALWTVQEIISHEDIKNSTGLRNV
jgi:hypothetical protein